MYSVFRTGFLPLNFWWFLTLSIECTYSCMYLHLRVSFAISKVKTRLTFVHPVPAHSLSSVLGSFIEYESTREDAAGTVAIAHKPPTSLP
jgi:hypothetical protein